MALLVATITFSACSSDDDDDKTSDYIVGTWQTTNEAASEEIQFLSNGTCYEILSLTGSSARLRYIGNYTLDGNKLTINWTNYQGWEEFLVIG